ncbi:MAG: hypothetical protein K0S33_1242 [Bacteroidetes bacterium]|jgi:hypothetical protein|nr:hypothetical protein [Bacteroidota bacterium]
MKTNPGEIPSIVFDWLKEQEFALLNAEQQTEVLRYFSMEEYNELHQALREVRQHSPAISSGKEKRKTVLLEAFDKEHQKPAASIYRLRPAHFMRAAAACVFFVAGWLGYDFLHSDKTLSEKIVEIRDTLYITKEIAALPQKVRDTVYVYRTGKSKATKTIPKNGTPGSMDVYAPINDMNVVSVKEFGSTLNASKGNSLKDDSLVKKFSFVTL